MNRPPEKARALREALLAAASAGIVKNAAFDSPVNLDDFVIDSPPSALSKDVAALERNRDACFALAGEELLNRWRERLDALAR